MAGRQEEVKVGAMVIFAAILFLSALVFVGGLNLFGKKKAEYTTYFKFAGGVEPGNVVRFGGLKVGTVERARIDPENSTRIKITLQVAVGTPIRTDSEADISTLGFLGENYVEISPGTLQAPLLHPGSTIPSKEIVQLADVFNHVDAVTVNANKLVSDLDTRFLVLADNANQLIKNFNGVMTPENQAHLKSFLSNLDATLAETRPQLRQTMANLQTVSAKIGPVADNANKALDQVDRLTGNLNKVVGENRTAIRQDLLELRQTLLTAHRLMVHLDDVLQANRGNLDETMDNVRLSTQNLKQFTDTIKQQPFSLIRIKTRKDRMPPFGK
jgi:phospholipid/cholesterol/gamma-HCH transport system substrate-binding protein